MAKIKKMTSEERARQLENQRRLERVIERRLAEERRKSAPQRPGSQEER
jgi:hypothetical protein